MVEIMKTIVNGCKDKNPHESQEQHLSRCSYCGNLMECFSKEPPTISECLRAYFASHSCRPAGSYEEALKFVEGSIKWLRAIFLERRFGPYVPDN